MNDFKFEVGKKYENMKGSYEVLSIDGDGMRICWDNGEEITTSRDFQLRVIKRMQREQELKEKARLKACADKRPLDAASKRKRFAGLCENDFSAKISGVTWRGRSGLGGAVHICSDADALDIKSWAVFRKPAIHWADVERHKREGLSSQANFFAAIDKKGLIFGFMVDCSGRTETAGSDWHSVVDWLKDPENDTWLQNTVVELNLSLSIETVNTSLSHTISVEDGRWSLSGKTESRRLESLPEFIEGLLGESRMELQIARRIEKKQAIARKEKIAQDIQELMERLMPLYKASAAS